ncbi:MAG: hypothetical protein IJQ93_02340 [Bacteroidales bacterium]|nr:hypothetical protein [Bacteroidales bacterium]
MRKCIIFLLLYGSALPLAAQRTAVERVWVVTNKVVYLAGERVYCSAFCLDAVGGGLSSLSRMAYLELHSADGLAVTGKLALDGGRGGGYLDLPAGLPTGNYALVAYTSQNKNEVGLDFSQLPVRTLSVFNTHTTDRVKDGVVVVSAEEYERCRTGSGMTISSVTPDPGLLSMSVEDGTLSLTNETGLPMTLSLSVWRDDGILPPAEPSLPAFLEATHTTGPRRFDDRVPPDYEGEVVQARITGLDQQQLQAITGRPLFLSTPSDQAEIYVAPVAGNGQVTFLTGNIYGLREMICQVEGATLPAGARIEFLSPFVNAPVAVPEALILSESIAPALEERATRLQAECQQTHTLSDYLPRKEYLLLDVAPVVYRLDDYTRFNTLEETFIEFIPQLRVRQDRSGNPKIQIRLEDRVDIPSFASEPALILLDGVPVFDHAKMLRYDPRLVKIIEVYPRTFYLGGRAWPGVVQFITQKRNLTSFKLDEGVRVLEFDGVSWPTEWTGDSFWHPLIGLAPGLTRQFSGILPATPGRYVIHVEGLTNDARQPLFATLIIER